MGSLNINNSKQVFFKEFRKEKNGITKLLHQKVLHGHKLCLIKQ